MAKKQARKFNRADEDLANIVGLEHLNVTVPDQRLATLFYITGMGFTRDPYLVTGVTNMWVNIGRNQFHLPTAAKPQVFPGTVGVVVPDIKMLKASLESVKKDLKGTKFKFSAGRNHIDVTCPWGNKFHCMAPSKKFGSTTLGVPYVEFDCKPGTAEGIARFYKEVLGAKTRVGKDKSGKAAHVEVGYHQHLIFRETKRKLPKFDGHHLQVYIADFSGPHKKLQKLGLCWQESNQYQYRFTDIVCLDTGKVLHKLEHEIRSMTHPLFGRHNINRNPLQHNNNFAPGHADRPYAVPEELRI
jgi:hypothetical protein